MPGKKAFFFLLLQLCFASITSAQDISPQLDRYFELIRPEFSGERAFQTTRYVSGRWRLPGNNGFNESIDRVEEILKEAGFQKEEGEASADLSYRIETYPLRQPAWEPVSASLSLPDEEKPLLFFAANRNMIAINSFSTPREGVFAEVVYIDQCNEEALNGLDVKGKIVLADCHSYPLFRLVVEKHGALGVLSYSIPDYNQPEKYVHSIPFSPIPFNSELKSWCINLSYHAREKLLAKLAKGPLKVRVHIETRIFPSEERAIIAEIKGRRQAEERFLFSAHVQEPGANDNASGVGALAEMARVAARLVKTGAIQPDRTLTFLWGDEIRATQRYIEQDGERAKGIRWGMSLDMVGEDTEKTGGTFLIEKMPDPSAIWTRGEDKHTEWGAGQVDRDEFNPHYFNDLITFICRKQGTAANWTVNTNPYEGGSDHVPFLRAGIPGLLLWHFTDVFYHTDADRIDKVSPATLANVGISGLTSAFFLANSSEQTARDILRITETAALERIETERGLSLRAIAKGGKIKEEEEIIRAWGDWYERALPTVRDVLLERPSGLFEKEVKKVTRRVTRTVGNSLKTLNN